jgi:transcriptional regulator with XRE-family HTH domain
MDCQKVGSLIASLRKEKELTQKELAYSMNISDRTISKWERGVGCPDVSLLNELSKILGVDISAILSGDLDPNGKDVGNMKNIKFYVCPICGNTLFSSGEAYIFCCGRRLAMLNENAASENHIMIVAEIEDDYYITIDHDMTKAHFVSFVAFIGYDRILLIKLYPEQNAEARFPKMPGYKLYAHCNEHGLWEQKLSF